MLTFPMFKQLFQQFSYGRQIIMSANSNDAFVFCEVETDQQQQIFIPSRWPL